MMPETVVNIPIQRSSNETKPSTVDHPLFSWVQMNYDYFKTAPGVCKIIQLVLGAICILLASPARLTSSQWFLFIVIISFIVSVIWLFIYLLSIREALNFPINWPLTECLNTVLLAIMYGIVTVMQICSWVAAHNTYGRTSNIIAGIFGGINTFMYLVGVYLAFVEWRNTHSIE